MKAMKVIVVLVTLCTFIGCRTDSKLRDDLAWMNNTYNPHPEASLSFGHGTTGWYSHIPSNNTERLTFGTIETFTNEGCKLTIQDVTDSRAQALSDTQTTSTYVVNLHDIDPGTLTVKTYSHYGGFACDN
jgi:hypothetical protein